MITVPEEECPSFNFIQQMLKEVYLAVKNSHPRIQDHYNI